MNYLNDMNELLQIIYRSEEIITLPRGNEGHVLLEFLRYTHFIKDDRFCCVATDKVDNVDNTLQKFDHFLPVIPFEYLPHFRESGLILVATPPQIHEMINRSLAQVGFKNVVFLSQNTINQLQAALKQFSSSGQVMSWFINHVTDKITEIEHRIEEQNEVCAVNTKAFAEYRNSFRGKKVVIVATGPTSKYYKPIPDAIHIGVNFAWQREDINFDYLFTVDGQINKPGKVQLEDGFDKIRERIFVGIYVPRNDWITFPENISLKKNVYRFYNNGGAVHQRIYKDICHHVLMEFWTVTHPAFHFALFTYPKEIYFVGCDTTPTGHFYSKTKQDDMVPCRMKVGYARLKMFAKHHYPGTEIFSINPVGLKGLFHDVYTKEYVASLNKGK